MFGIGAGGGDDGFELGLLGRQRVEVGVFGPIGDVHLFESRLGGKHRAHRLLDRFAHRVLGIELGFLLQVADRHPGHGQRLSLELLVHTRHDLEQRGLARPVQAEHADLGAGEERKRNVLQELPLGRHGLADAVHRIDVLSHLGVVTLGSGDSGNRGRPKAIFGRGKPHIIDSCDNTHRCRVQLPAAPALCRGRRKPFTTLLRGRTFRLPPLTFICLDWLGVTKRRQAGRCHCAVYGAYCFQ
ncbi:hypothetical protein ABID97_004213 [Variovorax sp. OAS795]